MQQHLLRSTASSRNHFSNINSNTISVSENKKQTSINETPNVTKKVSENLIPVNADYLNKPENIVDEQIADTKQKKSRIVGPLMSEKDSKSNTKVRRQTVDQTVDLPFLSTFAASHVYSVVFVKDI